MNTNTRRSTTSTPHSAPQRILSEIHSNSITTLLFHPTNPTLLISGSSDSTLSISNLAEPDDDNVQLASVVHPAPVQHIATFAARDGQPGVCAVSDDERFAAYVFADDGLERLDPEDDAGEDLRGLLDVRYTAWMRASTSSTEGGGVLLCAGKNAANPEVVDLDEDSAMVDGAKVGAERAYPCALVVAIPPRYVAGAAVVGVFEGGHGEEIVRDLWVREGVAVSGGEDGFVRVWEAEGRDVEEGSVGRVRKRKEGKEKVRHKPY